MLRIALILLALAGALTPANAWRLGGLGGTVAVGSCSNSLDMSQACNSAYAGAF